MCMYHMYKNLVLHQQVLAKALEAEQQRLEAVSPATKGKAGSGGGARASVAAAFRKEKAAVLAVALAAVQQRAEALQSAAANG